MKEIKLFFKRVLYGRKPCMIMSGLNFKALPVNYGSVVIDGIDRPPRAKIWTVAVTTVEPEKTCKSQASWMIEIQFARASATLRAAEIEYQEILIDLKPYMKGVAWEVPKSVKNS